MSDNPEHPSIRRIVLPSGRSIEVMQVSDARTRGLHSCGWCDSNLVQPLVWSEADAGRWALTLECPNCGWLQAGTYDDDQIEQLEERLDQGLAEVLEDLRRLTHANMSEEIERFTTALRGDLILPEDF